ncbi:MAG: hypothetical protein K9N10_01750 [Deltaproteobacteria bacterium]|nr:hypothetical protein [Deltaproteobacteria bacterium]
MATIQPEGKNVRQAIKWISENLKENEMKTPIKVIEEAGARFNLSPKDEEFLRSFYG